MPTRRDRAIAGAQCMAYSGNLPDRPKWPAPLDVAGDKDDRVRTAQLASIGGEQLHFRKKVPGRDRQVLLRAGILKRRDAESARLKNRPEPTSDGHAERTLGVEKQPAARGPAAFTVGYF